MALPRVFFDIVAAAPDGRSLGRIVFQLFANEVPKTVENFRALCTGEMGVAKASGACLWYKDSVVHRVIPEFMIQGGDFTKKNGTGGESIYGAPFEDEDLSRPIDSEGLLVMANRGPNTNGAQWFITLAPCPHLSGKHVVFGKVIRGFDVVKAIENVETDDKDVPKAPIVITHCGELQLRQQPPPPPAPTAEESGAKKRGASESAGSESEEDRRERKRRKKEKKEKRRREKEEKGSQKRYKDEDGSASRSPSPSRSKSGGAQSGAVANSNITETEEEYDSRLEREEKERLELQKKTLLQRMKDEAQIDPRTGIRYKGRGTMKFMDPEKYRR